MMKFNEPIPEIIQRRFSCRAYLPEPIIENKRIQLQDFIQALPPGPFGTRPRFELLASHETDSKALRGLGTYGFIRNPAAFIVGAMFSSENSLEDFGYLMQAIILYATSLELGTCWLGGTFTKSKFAQKIQLSAGETIPAVTSIGEFAVSGQNRQGVASQAAGSFKRLAWEDLFADIQQEPGESREIDPGYLKALEMVRLGPSASNKQPWRIRQYGKYWRFYLQRTPGYRQGLIKNLLDLCDLQRLDMGISMCHFEYTALELGLEGKWTIEVDLPTPQAQLTEYIISWEDKTIL